MLVLDIISEPQRRGRAMDGYSALGPSNAATTLSALGSAKTGAAVTNGKPASSTNACRSFMSHLLDREQAAPPRRSLSRRRGQIARNRWRPMGGSATTVPHESNHCSGPHVAVQHSIINGLAQVRYLNPCTRIQVRDRPGNAKYLVVCPCGKPQFIHGALK